LSTCRFPDHKNVTMVDGNEKPSKDACWRFAYRFRQQKCKESIGFMIQVEEEGGLGPGQMIETEMAREVGIKVFRTYMSSPYFHEFVLKRLSAAVKEWYNKECANADLENVFIGYTGAKWTKRPKYGTDYTACEIVNPGK